MPAKTKLKKKNQINLLPQEGLSSSTGGQILLWLLSTFRFIVIAVELFVVAAFLSRFWLDAKNTNLSDEIQNNKSIIESFQNFEKEFKNTQQRLTIYSAYSKDKGKIIEAINSVITSKPPEVTFSTITAGENDMKISASSVSELGIQQFLVNLKSNEKIENVNLGDISSSEGGSSLIFDIVITYKKT
jgi:Tfp pilus assembly protein PilN